MIFRREVTAPHDRSFIDDSILYAEVGKDRLNLPDDYVARTRRQIEHNPWRLPT